MLKRFFSFLYGDIPARFPSDFSLSESVARLREGTKRSIFSALLRQAAVGRVTASRVRLQRVIPFFGNSFKPIFVGTFTESHGRVVLEGRFTMFLFSKVFMTVWLAFAVVWTLLAAFAVIMAVSDNPGKLGGQPMTLLFPLVGVAFFVAGVAFVRFSWWLSRKDMTFLEPVIRQALSRGTSTGA